MRRNFIFLLPLLLSLLSLIQSPASAADPSPRDLIIERLIQMADDPDARVRFQTALTLGDVDSPRRIEALTKIARRDCADRWVRTAILTAVNDDADSLLVDLMATEGAPPEGMAALAEGLGSIVGARAQLPELGGVIATAAETGAGTGGTVAAAALRGLAAGIKLNEGRKIEAREAGGALEKLQSTAYGDDLRGAAKKLAAMIGTGGPKKSGPAAQVKDILGAAAPRENENRPDDERLAALAGLQDASLDSADWSALPALLAPAESDEFRSGVIESLRAVDAPEPHKIIIAQFGGFSPAVREKALEIVFSRRERIGFLLDAVESGAIGANKLDSGRRAQLLKYPNTELAARAAGALGAGPETGALELYEKYKPALDLAGDPARGAKTHEARCMQCHRAGGVGHDVGPNWAGLKSNPPDKLLLNILYPSQNILPGFTQYVIELNNGRVAMGIIAASTPSSIVLRRGGGEEETILRRNIRSMSDTALSIMPEGLEDGLALQDMADILAFIKAVE